MFAYMHKWKHSINHFSTVNAACPRCLYICAHVSEIGAVEREHTHTHRERERERERGNKPQAFVCVCVCERERERAESRERLIMAQGCQRQRGREQRQPCMMLGAHTHHNKEEEEEEESLLDLKIDCADFIWFCGHIGRVEEQDVHLAIEPLPQSRH